MAPKPECGPITTWGTNSVGGKGGKERDEAGLAGSQLQRGVRGTMWRGL